MDFTNIWQQFLSGLRDTSGWEFIAVISGIASVWLSKKANVLTYPVGLVNTILYVYLSFKGHLLGEASVNIFYTIMSLYGWYVWTRKDNRQNLVTHIRFSTGREWLQQLMFFCVLYAIIYFSLIYLKESFAEGAIPWADGFASAAAYTGMLLMARKKVESWIWWIITDITSVPLYFVKGYVFTSVYYLILTAMAVAGLLAWYRMAKNPNAHAY